MNRLLQGDVGSGKTIVAFLSMIYASLCGFQSVLMAPTDVLATQHYDNLKKIISDNSLNVNICLLKSKISKNERKQILEDIKKGSINIIIGTHAVFSKDVEYTNLSYIVIDGQHKFGVDERRTIEEKSLFKNLLIMSATPIPRTL